MAAGNVKMSVKGNTLTIEVDLTKDLGPSVSGKSNFIANTGGFTSLEGHDGVKVSLNVIKPRNGA